MRKNQNKITAEFKWGFRAAGLIGLLAVAGWILMIRYELPEDSLLAVIMTAGTCAYTVLALLIIRRHSRHAVGWLFIITGFSGSLIIFVAGLFAWGAQWDSVLAQQLITWLDLQVQNPWTIIPITLVLLYFPDGHLPTPRWKPVMIIVLVSIFYNQASPAFTPWTGEYDRGPFNVDNPLEIAGSEFFFSGIVGTLFSVLTIVGILGCLASVVVRLIRSKGAERMQMKWLVYSAVVVISLILTLLSLGVAESEPEIMWYLTLSSPVMLALAIGMAILRYRLFEIDIIIRRTLQYGILTIMLGFTYLGIVFVLQNVFAAISGQSSPIAIVLSTLVIAGLFNPLRIRLQEFIDKRFYRRKYDAQLLIERFSESARNETDLYLLTGRFLAVVQDTMEPDRFSMWLRQ
jgi:hypothetical protein